jgi:hypothetical protein
MKTYAQWLAASVAVVAVGYATYSAWGDDTHVEAPAAGDRTKSMPLPSPVESTNLSDLRSEAPTPRAEFAAVRLSAGSKTESSIRIQDTQPAPLAADPAAIIAQRETARAEDEQRFNDYLGATAADFDREGRDPRWSSETGAALQAAFGSEDLKGVQYQNIDCRKTMCRVEIVDDGSGAAAEALHKVGTAIGSTLPNMLVDRVDHGNGRATMVLYLSSQ